VASNAGSERFRSRKEATIATLALRFDGTTAWDAA
jgi:hypothetical protein